MPAEARELFEGSTETVGQRPRATVRWVVTGAIDEADAKTLLLATVPGALAGLARLSITLDERVNADTWTATAEYGIPDRTQQEAPEPIFAFDTGGTPGQEVVAPAAQRLLADLVATCQHACRFFAA
jgi:hypothetical protein